MFLFTLDESLPPSPHKATTTVTTTAAAAATTITATTTTILVDEQYVAPDTVTDKPETIDSPLSLELDLESQHIEDLHNFSVVPEDELHFDGDKLRNGTDSAIGDVYSNGNSSTTITTTTTTSKDVSNSLADLKQNDEVPSTLNFKVETQTNLLDGDKNDLVIDQQDNLSSSPSWNLDSIRQTPEPEFGAFSIGELNPNDDIDDIVAEQTSLEENFVKALDEKFEHTFQHSDHIVVSDDENKSVPLDDEQRPSKTANNCNDSGFRKDNSFDDFNDAEFSANATDFETNADFGEFNADFGQFATFEDANQVQASESSPSESSKQCDKTDNYTPATAAFDGGGGGEDDDDDEFGEFSDFQQTPAAVQTERVPQKDVSKNTSVLLDSENIKLNISSVLTAMFPSDESAIGGGDNSDTSTGYHYQSHGNSTGNAHFINDLTTQLRNVENSNALAHQWAKSTSKAVLVKALGIDSRNIVRIAFFIAVHFFVFLSL